ncbi:MAG: mandelate racemase/muconate lactonizing enzyme family protein [Chitinophagaceae bacterium]|nr:mandelate racemase/muconate lactonizing enzyme family protein [Rubrivivax sp.]
MTHVSQIDTFIVTLPRDTPYLGPLADGEHVNARGYVVRKGNGTLYPIVDRSVVVRLRTQDGLEGWGETYGLCAPRATCELINELLGPVLIGQDPAQVEAIWDQLYGLMRVRGCIGGFHGDALAAVDIALWDLGARAQGRSIAQLLHPQPAARVPCYLSGLPAATLAERVALALHWRGQGIEAFKFAAVVSHEGVAEEMAMLREALGPTAEIMVDLHWKYSADEALALARRLAPQQPVFIEAPVKPEDQAGFRRVCAESPVPIAAGEEWYTGYEFTNRCCPGLAFVQPEMAHTGITAFRRIAAQAPGLAIAPHATIGVGLFLAASLQVSSGLAQLWRHEWQHSVFERNLALLDTDMGREGMHYRPPGGPGLGTVPNARFWQHAEHVC